MPAAKQQQAKDMSKFWQDGQASLSQPKTQTNQQFTDNRGDIAYQRQKADESFQYNRQLYDMNQWAQNSTHAKAKQNDADRQNQLTQSNNSTYAQRKLADLEETKFKSKGGSSSTAFGMYAPPPSGSVMNAYGQSFSRPGQISDWQHKQGLVAANNKMFAEADAAGDIVRMKAQADVNAQAARFQAQQAQNQSSLDAQREGQNRVFQAQEAEKERQSRQQLAMTQSYSVNPGSYQYWGGRV